MRDFFHTHQCDAICRYLNLAPLGEDPSAGRPQNQTSARSSPAQPPTKVIGSLTTQLALGVIYEGDGDHSEGDVTAVRKIKPFSRFEK